MAKFTLGHVAKATHIAKAKGTHLTKLHGKAKGRHKVSAHVGDKKLQHKVKMK